VRANAYTLLMLKQLAARGSLFLFVRTHQHLEYYFNLNDTRLAANQNGLLTPSGASRPPAKVVEIHPISRAAHAQLP
jgi:hypothetical protein